MVGYWATVTLIIIIIIITIKGIYKAQDRLGATPLYGQHSPVYQVWQKYLYLRPRYGQISKIQDGGQGVKVGFAHVGAWLNYEMPRET